MVLIAILLMAGSAMLNYFVINANNAKISAMTLDAQKLDTLIHDDWYNAGQLYRDADAAVIVSLLAEKDAPEAESIKRHYLSRLDSVKSNETSLPKILKIVDAQHLAKVEAINNTYLQKLSIENDIMQLSHQNGLFSNISFFLQIMGLVLVIISREMPDV